VNVGVFECEDEVLFVLLEYESDVEKTALHQPAFLYDVLHLKQTADRVTFFYFTGGGGEGEVVLEGVEEQGALFEAVGGGGDPENHSLSYIRYSQLPHFCFAREKCLYFLIIADISRKFPFLIRDIETGIIFQQQLDRPRILVAYGQMQCGAVFGELVEVEVGLLEEEGDDIGGVVEDGELERSVVVDGEQGGVGAFDQQEGDHICLAGVDCPVQCVPAAVSQLLQQVPAFQRHQLVQLRLVLYRRLFPHDLRYLLQTARPHAVQHPSQTLLQVV
jgi:hypothetical protein